MAEEKSNTKKVILIIIAVVIIILACLYGCMAKGKSAPAAQTTSAPAPEPQKSIFSDSDGVATDK
ncbi:MAG: hypothetical protein IJQ27_03155 [Spirochaetia bacterium]|nr:hypothetical protein [Spirochaetia bacterium]